MFAPARLAFEGDDIDPLTPAATQSFEGVNQTCSFLIPSDHALAVNSPHVVQLVNSCILVLNKSGVVQAGFPKSLNAFLGLPANAFTFDPRAIYDWTTNKFVVAIDQSDSSGNFIWVAASATANPTGNWFRYRISVPGILATDFPDFPTLGLDRDIIYLGANVFRGNSFIGDTVMFLPKARIETGQAIGSFNFGFNFNVGGNQVDTIQPAHVVRKIDRPRAGFMVNSFNIRFGGGQCSSGCNGLVVWAVSNALVAAGSPGIQITGVVVPTATTYRLPPDARQKNCPSGACLVDTGDTRMSGQVTYATGRLWASHNTRRTNGQTTFVWYELRPFLNDGNANCTGSFLNKCAQITSAEILNEDCYFCGGRGANGSDWFATVVPDQEGDATAVAAYSDDNNFPGVFYVSRRVTQAKNTMHDAGIFLAAGQAGPYQQLDQVGRNRWGDYTAASADLSGQTDQIFWFAAQYSKLINGGVRWATRIGKNAFTAPNQP